MTDTIIIDTAADPINLADPADWIETEHASATMPVSEHERLRRLVALTLAAPLIEHERADTLDDTPAHRAFESLLWGLVANIGAEADEEFEGYPSSDMTDEGFDADTRGLMLDGATVCGSLTIAALAALGQGWRFRHPSGYVLVVVRDAAGLRFVQPMSGFVDPVCWNVPRVPITAPAVQTVDELVPLMRAYIDLLDRMTGWGLMDECGGDDEPCLYWCYAGGPNQNHNRPDELVVDMQCHGTAATLTLARDGYAPVRLAGLSVAKHGDGDTWRLTDEATGARFDVVTADPYYHGGRFTVCAMDLAAVELIDQRATVPAGLAA